MNPNIDTSNAYDPGFQQTYPASEEYISLNLDMSDDMLEKMVVRSLDMDVAYWQQKPWDLQKTDADNTRFYLGDQLDKPQFAQTVSGGDDDVDNRMFSSLRAILSYATGQLARPDITPSRGDDVYLRGAQTIRMAMYQHAQDDQVEIKVKVAVQNLLTRKRGFLKLRFDPYRGVQGDIVTEVVPPEDIIFDRFAKFLSNPNKIYQRIRCSVEELVSKFPDKKAEIYRALKIERGVYTQLSRYITYYECWFTYYDTDGTPQEGVCWFLPEDHLILDKMRNPNWVYKGSLRQQKQENVLDCPPKPFVWFNYLNTGHSIIDDTSLFDQAKPLQKMLNRRNRQLNLNIDFMNGRWIANKKVFSEADAQKFINRGPRTVALVNAEDVTKAIAAVTSNVLPNDVYSSVVDFRNEIDELMGTPSVFKGASPKSQDTLGRDLLLKQQAGALQDDLVRSVGAGMEQYYKLLLQMMRVYYTEDYWFKVKGADGKYDFVFLNGDTLDSNVKVSVEVDSTLPLDKNQIRATAIELWKSDKAIDYKTLMEDLGLPNPDVRTERYMQFTLDPLSYFRSIDQGLDNSEAEVDIALILNNKIPDERDTYDADYLNYFNHFLTTNRFAGLPTDAKQRVVQWLMAVQHIVSESANMQATALVDEATGMLEPPAPAPAPTVAPGGQPGQAQPGTPPPGGAPTAPPQAPPPAPVV